MTAKNDVTGDSIMTKGSSQAYRDNWERIFGKKDQPKQNEEVDNDNSGEDHCGQHQ